MLISNIKEVILTTLILTLGSLLIKYIKSRNRSKDTIYITVVTIFTSLFLTLFLSVGLLFIEQISVKPLDANIINLLYIYIILIIPLYILIHLHITFVKDEKKQREESPGGILIMGSIPFITFFSIIKNIIIYIKDLTRTTLLIHIGILILIFVISIAIIIHIDRKKRINKNQFAYYIADIILIIGIMQIFIGTYNIISFFGYKQTTAVYTEINIETDNTENNLPTTYFTYKYKVNEKSEEYGKDLTKKDEIGNKIELYYKKEDPSFALPKRPPITTYLVFGTIFIAISKCIRTIKRKKDKKNETQSIFYENIRI